MAKEIQQAITPLLGAEARVRRAGQLLGTLKRQLQAWANAHQHFIEAVQHEDGKIGLVLTGTDTRRMTRLSVTLGEITYNLRASLDYAVYDLAMIGAGKEVQGTQFPIEDTQAGFLSRVVGKNAKGKAVAHYLKGVPKPAIARIATLQPYAGCKWTRDLRELSNPDKHRHLSPLRSDFNLKTKGFEVIATDPESGKQTIRVQYDAEVEVFFADGRPVLETLQAIHREVVATLALFKRSIKSV